MIYLPLIIYARNDPIRAPRPDAKDSIVMGLPYGYGSLEG